MQNIVLDTNFLVTAYKFKLDIFEELKNVLDTKFQVYIVDKTINELEKLIKSGKLTDKVGAMVSIKYLKRKNIKIINTVQDNDVDELLLALSPAQFIVATQDKALKKRLKQKKFKVLTIRQRKQIVLEN
ncbi:hypothetical protein D6777_00510 [Candidatus Woesearchaeota archaeon]|nr:MAG: hypothetical protein D6777_00510 [Candidatus Woesearchaeota archaeon]